jgi:hypothetical protein
VEAVVRIAHRGTSGLSGARSLITSAVLAIPVTINRKS